jgi:uncharacterized protein (DUF885 family)
MSSIDRRHFLGLAGTAAMLPSLPQLVSAAEPAGDAETERMLSGIADALLAEYPENATALGIDKGANGALKSRLTDRSPDANRRRAASAADRLARLKAVDPSHLGTGTALDLAVTRIAHELAVEGYRFPYGDMAILNNGCSYRNTPYAVSQGTGAFAEIPDFLDSLHVIAAPADADSYLARLEAYAAALDGETARLRHDAGIGVIAPAFLLDKTLRQMKAARAQPLPEWGIVTSVAKRSAGFPGDPAARALRIASEKVAPALDRQIAFLAELRTRATDDAGVWKLPDGEAYYAWALRAGTTSDLSPDQVHQLGLDQVRELAGRMEPLLRAQGLTKGTVGERMAALGQDPRYLYPNTDAGRAELLAYLNGRIADIRTRLPRAFATLVRGNLIIKRVPPEIEAGMPGGYAGPGAIDGSTPGNYYINLRDTANWPKFSLPTLCYHEGIPGHVWQGEYSYKLPLIRALLAFNAYSEGWALYAEQLGDELGAYDEDPLGRLGYLQSLSYRACRLVVDTGLHAKRWTRAQAINWFATTNGSSVDDVSSEVDRYCAWPGQACGYKVGHSEIVRLRGKAQTALGPRYDLRTFDDAVVRSGNVPLTLLEQVIDTYIAEQKARV